jgi:hypothetical protein
MSTTQLAGTMVELSRLGLPADIGQAPVSAVSVTHRDVTFETNPPQKIIGAVIVIGQGPLQQFYRCSCVCLLFLLGSNTSSTYILCIGIAQHCKTASSFAAVHKLPRLRQSRAHLSGFTTGEPLLSSRVTFLQTVGSKACTTTDASPAVFHPDIPTRGTLNARRVH